jgi:hypothetical protein
MKNGLLSRRRASCVFLSGLVLGLCPGCAGYQLGRQSLYRPDIQTVHVPVFESSSFRPDFGQRLTEAVAKEIELKTPYKVVDGASADTILTGRVIADRKQPLAMNRGDFPINTNIDLMLQVAWEDRRGNLIGQSTSIPLFPSLLSVSQSSRFVPEGGQSITTAQFAAIDQLAQQIVAQMEMPW